MTSARLKTAATAAELDARLLHLTAEHAALNDELNAGLHSLDGNILDEPAERLSAMEERIDILPVPYTLPGIAGLLRVKTACIGTRWPERA